VWPGRLRTSQRKDARTVHTRLSGRDRSAAAGAARIPPTDSRPGVRGARMPVRPQALPVGELAELWRAAGPRSSGRRRGPGRVALPLLV